MAVEALEHLKDLRVRVVSFPSWELFREQSIDYQSSVFPDGVPILAIEAASTVGWREYSHGCIGMHTFGASAPYKKVFEKFGITSQAINEKARKLIQFYSDSKMFPHGAPSVVKRAFYD